MAGNCKTCKHKIQNPKYLKIGVCGHKKSIHAGKCVGDTLMCKHHEMQVKNNIHKGRK
jgi:hypothetical protein